MQTSLKYFTIASIPPTIEIVGTLEGIIVKGGYERKKYKRVLSIYGMDYMLFISGTLLFVLCSIIVILKRKEFNTETKEQEEISKKGEENE